MAAVATLCVSDALATSRFSAAQFSSFFTDDDAAAPHRAVGALDPVRTDGGWASTCAAGG